MHYIKIELRKFGLPLYPYNGIAIMVSRYRYCPFYEIRTRKKNTNIQMNALVKWHYLCIINDSPSQESWILNRIISTGLLFMFRHQSTLMLAYRAITSPLIFGTNFNIWTIRIAVYEKYIFRSVKLYDLFRFSRMFSVIKCHICAV